MLRADDLLRQPTIRLRDKRGPSRRRAP